MNDIAAVLAGHPFFAGLDPAMVTTLASLATERRYAAGAWMARSGTPADQFHVLLSGRAGIEIVAPGHRPLVIATVHGGEVAGWSWFVEPHRWHFDVVALDDVHALTLDAVGVRAACEQDHELGFRLGRRLTQVMAARVEATRHQVVDLYGRR